MNVRGRFLALVLVLVTVLFPVHSAQAQTEKQTSGATRAFLLASTYGVLAGTLTGLASLAFYEDAGAHGRNVAMGASLGLYVGILLGAYIVYAPQLAAPSEPGSDEPELSEEDLLGQAAPARHAPLLSWNPQAGYQMGWVYRF